MSISIHHVSKRFGNFVALDDVSLEVESGKLIALLGPSGSGKTTLLRIISGLENSDQGSILIQDEDVTEQAVRDRNIGFVFQHYALFRHMTVFENVAFGLRIRKTPRSEVQDRVHELLTLVKLEGLGKRFPAELSGGQRQRVALARALAVRPRMLLLDEPFGALDAITRNQMNFELLRIHSTLNATIVFVTHDLHEAALLSDRIVVMTARPGAIQQIVESAIPRPRTKSTTFSSEFNELVKTLGEILAAH